MSVKTKSELLRPPGPNTSTGVKRGTLQFLNAFFTKIYSEFHLFLQFSSGATVRVRTLPRVAHPIRVKSDKILRLRAGYPIPQDSEEMSGMGAGLIMSLSVPHEVTE